MKKIIFILLTFSLNISLNAMEAVNESEKPHEHEKATIISAANLIYLLDHGTIVEVKNKLDELELLFNSIPQEKRPVLNQEIVASNGNRLRCLVFAYGMLKQRYKILLDQENSQSSQDGYGSTLS